jgi:hypothetical protein
MQTEMAGLILFALALFMAGNCCGIWLGHLVVGRSEQNGRLVKQATAWIVAATAMAIITTLVWVL